MTQARVITMLIMAGSLLTGLAAQAADDNAWTIQKPAWEEKDEKAFSEFIQTLGEKGCLPGKRCTVDVILKSAANPWRATDPSGVTWKADCAKFPYLLRAYFAWKNHLPFSYVSDVDTADGSNKDLRYSPNGNVATQRTDVVQKSAQTSVNGVQAVQTMLNMVNSSRFRFHPDFDNKNNLFFDYYPVSIDRQNIKPGTVIYDPAGHVVVIYKIESDGRIRFFDAHPDNTVSRGVYGEKFQRSRPGMGSGFKNFRRIYLSEATRLSDGTLIGGKMVTWPNSQQPGFSKEQFYGTQPAAPTDASREVRDKAWKNGKFTYNGTTYPYYDYVRTRLAIGELKYHPVEEMVNAMDALCGDIQDRAGAVNEALLAKIHLKAQPAQLPNNIYGTSGEWETYSSPSRDARLKTSFRELLTNVQQMVEMYKQGSSRVIYEGTNLGADLREAYAEKAQSCAIEYTRSNGTKVSLNYDDVAERLFALSFDPYHCVERRWGATSPHELSSCGDGQNKQNWYNAEQRLRNQIDRTYDIKMNFTLEQLRSGAPGTGPANPPNIDLKGYLHTL